MVIIQLNQFLIKIQSINKHHSFHLFVTFLSHFKICLSELINEFMLIFPFVITTKNPRIERSSLRRRRRMEGGRRCRRRRRRRRESKIYKFVLELFKIGQEAGTILSSGYTIREGRLYSDKYEFLL